MASGMVGKIVQVKCIESSNIKPVYGIVQSMDGEMLTLSHVRQMHNGEETDAGTLSIPMSQLFSFEVMQRPALFPSPTNKDIVDLKDLHLNEQHAVQSVDDDDDMTSTHQMLQEPGDEDEEDEDDDDYEISEPESEEPDEEFEEDEEDEMEETDIKDEAKDLRADTAAHNKMLFNYAVEAAVLEKERKKMMKEMKKQASMQIIDLDADEMQQDA